MILYPSEMSGQKPLHFLRATKYWSMVQQFLDDPTEETLSLPPSVTAAERDQIRQICKHFDVPFKVHGEGSEKFMMLRKPDFSYLEQAEEEQRKALSRDQQEVERLSTLVRRLSNDVNVERIKAAFLKAKLSTEVEKETATKELEYIRTEKDGFCGICTERPVTRLSEACGHSCCSECFDVARCALCDQEVVEVTELTSSDSSYPNKRLRTH